MFDAIESLLSNIGNYNSRKSFEAAGLLNTLQSGEFLMSLNIFVKVLSIIHVLHKSFQSKQCDLLSAAIQIIGTIRALKAIHNNLEWNSLWDSVKE